MSFSVRIANTTKGAVAVESIETNFPKLLKNLGPSLTHQEAWIESSSEDANGENHLQEQFSRRFLLTVWVGQLLQRFYFLIDGSDSEVATITQPRRFSLPT